VSSSSTCDVCWQSIVQALCRVLLVHVQASAVRADWQGMIEAGAAGLPPPNFPMPAPFWPQMANHMGQAASQSSRQQGPFSSDSSGNLDPLSAAYYSSLGAQQMAAAMAAAAVRLPFSPCRPEMISACHLHQWHQGDGRL
jgi:hypothetical protein